MKNRKHLETRKANYAAHVNFITPYAISMHADNNNLSAYIKQVSCKVLSHNLLDNPISCGIIYLTALFYSKGSFYGDHNHGRLWQGKNGCTSGQWDVELSILCGQGRVVFGKRVFRSPGFGSGEVRDASPCSRRRNKRINSISNVWIFEGCVLSDIVIIRGRRNSGFAAASARPEARSQAQRRSHGFCDCSTGRRGLACFQGVGVSCAKEVWNNCPSSQYRAGDKTPAKKGAIEFTSSSELSQQCSEGYEQLRKGVIDGDAYCNEGMGFGLFLRKGFTCWFDVWSQIKSERTVHPVPKLSVSNNETTLPKPLRSQMVVMLAGMVLNKLQQEVA